jgi:hypothetical protein
MSQNGPWPGTQSHPWSRGSDERSGGSDEPEPYAEPADPWAADPSWEPAYPHSYGSLNGPPPGWGAPPPSPPRRNTPLVALVIVLAALAVVGLTTSALLLNRGGGSVVRGSAAGTSPSVTSPAASPASPHPSADARFVTRGQCVRNEGSADAPVMTVAACGAGTYQVLKRIDGRTTGQADAEAKCAKVPGYTKWYFYDSELDSLDFVLCLKER